MNRSHLAIVVRGAYPPSAVSSVALHHARQLGKKFRVSMLSDTFAEETRSGCSDGDYTAIRVKVPQFNYLHHLCHVPNEMAFCWSVSRQLQRLHSERPIDFLWCHSHPVAAWPLYHFRCRFHIPYGLTVHGDIFERPRGTYDPLLTRFYREATPKAYRRASVIQVLAPVWKQSVLRWGVDNQKIVMIPNGISKSEFLPARAIVKGKDDRLSILYVGRLRIEKGVETLLRAAVILRDRGVVFEILLIGNGPKSKELKSFAANNGLNECVHFLGTIPREQLGRFYAAADVVCVPSISEPLATVVLEALVHGTPVLASDVGGNSFMVEDGRTGWLVEPNDPNALADRLEKLAANREACLSMAQHAQNAVTEKFSWDKIGDELAGVLRSQMHLDSR